MERFACRFYAGIVTPVIHYCMGGIAIDADGHVLDKDHNIIPGLHAGLSFLRGGCGMCRGQEIVQHEAPHLCLLSP